MLPNSLSSGVFELMASPGSTLRLPGPASGMRAILTNFERALVAPRSLPTSRAGTSANVPAIAGAAATVPIPADAKRNRPRRESSGAVFPDMRDPPLQANFVTYEDALRRLVPDHAAAPDFASFAQPAACRERTTSWQRISGRGWIAIPA